MGWINLKSEGGLD